VGYSCPFIDSKTWLGIGNSCREESNDFQKPSIKYRQYSQVLSVARTFSEPIAKIWHHLFPSPPPPIVYSTQSLAGSDRLYDKHIFIDSLKAEVHK
jgi:hypothetical protein